MLRFTVNGAGRGRRPVLARRGPVQVLLRDSDVRPSEPARTAARGARGGEPLVRLHSGRPRSPHAPGLKPPLRDLDGTGEAARFLSVRAVGGRGRRRGRDRKDGAVGTDPRGSRRIPSSRLRGGIAPALAFSPALDRGKPGGCADPRLDARGRRGATPARARLRLALGVRPRRRVAGGALAARGERREAGSRGASGVGAEGRASHRGRWRPTAPSESSGRARRPAPPPKSGKPSRRAASSRARETTGWSFARATASSPRPR